ncbi:hypothetical protein [Agromyces italicus]|uniref:hypothetical protein n=1 Tax=Agromyces italicus TaxID=279572 RepID=UPI0003B73E16|nr:hypothetical protein [Agromyces italicus]
MSSTIDRPRRARNLSTTLPPIGIWWPMLEGPLRQEILENLDAPLRTVVVARILELCEADAVVPRTPVHLDENERAYIAGWVHAVDWS